ncbi:ATP-grasp domain-containing protein [Streptomyces sp. NEAU-Y11]|uniref:ATP-grasp domain-containing protein n=1 Tax=Streptomyces cucumeris TaxID=2962890 RepID=UPI0020C901AE|nr:ATP-grasp domain-containing protein [Streptomyces sp. NEAU-Y11]MCP9211490.1 ATP-grasp domain-containing protein [Streptomyces sp. NEAU-Y11]
MTRTSSRKTVVIVDGYSNAPALIEAFAERGYQAVHVLGSAEPYATMVQPRPEDYAHWLVCPDETAVAATVDRLAALDPIAVIPGQEPGVRLADTLSERLYLAGNGTTLSRARRDKYEMIETLRAAGIRCAEQLKTGSAQEAADWAHALGTTPVVVKPLASASADNVYICHTLEEVAAAVDRILASRTVFDEPNTEVLVQSFLQGPEFSVDTVSAKGTHYLADVWESRRKAIGGGRQIYDMAVLLDPEREPVSALFAYVRTVLDALGIRHGAAHSEIIMTPQGPTLVEIGARMNGAMIPDFYDAVLGTNVARLVAYACTEPEDFARTHGGLTYRPLQTAAVYEAPTVLDGIVESVDEAVVNKIAALPSVYAVALRSGPGKRIRPTTDLTSSPLRVLLASTDEQALLHDREAVDSLKDLVFHVR